MKIAIHFKHGNYILDFPWVLIYTVPMIAIKESVMDTKEQMRIERENKAAGRTCKNAKYEWHQVDGYCKECQIHHEDSAVIEARRNDKGYR